MSIPLIPLVDEILGLFKGAQEKGLQIEQLRASLLEKLAQHDADTVAAVNATMQAEARSEHFLQYSWRPLVGLTFCAILINNYILVPYFSWVHPLPIPDLVWWAMLSVLGVTAIGRSVEKTLGNNGGITLQVPPVPLVPSIPSHGRDDK